MALFGDAYSRRVYVLNAFFEFKTFRMRGHEEASGTKYVPNELLTEWETKDPLTNYRKYLLNIGVLTAAKDEELHQAFKAEIDDALQLAGE